MLKRLKYIILISFLALIQNCTMLFFWNPIVDNFEFDKKLSFSYKGIHFNELKLGFFNNVHSPTLFFDLKNNLDDTLYIDLNRIYLKLAKDTINSKNNIKIKIPPNNTNNVKIKYQDVRLEHVLGKSKNGNDLYFPNPSEAYIIFSGIKYKNENINIPVIKFIFPITKIK